MAKEVWNTSTPTIQKIFRRVFPKKAHRKNCPGHQLKHYFNMHSHHIDVCPNFGGCSHDCRICDSIRRSRASHVRRQQDSIERNVTMKYRKACQEAKRAEIAERARQAEEHGKIDGDEFGAEYENSTHAEHAEDFEDPDKQAY